MTRKPRILTLIGSYLPGYKSGGPVVSISNMVSRLGDEFDFHVLTADRDLGDTGPYPGIARDEWQTAHGARVRYCSPERQKFAAVAAAIRETPHDVLYLNSFFDRRFSISALVARRMGTLPSRPTILAPRGEFSPGALALKQHRKRAYMRSGKALGLFHGLHWHASAAHEHADIRAAMAPDASHVTIACDLTAALSHLRPQHVPRAPGAPLRVVFLSRISPMKNLAFALEVLAGAEMPMVFTIVGPEEDAAYSERCRALAEQLPAHIRVRWAGALPPADVPQAMADHDLFFLPTLGENFGHVIAEALGAGTPVLLSDTTPWRGLARLGIGHDLPLDQPHLFRDALHAAWRQTPAEAAATRARAAAGAHARQQDSTDAEANRALFRAALARG